MKRCAVLSVVVRVPLRRHASGPLPSIYDYFCLANDNDFQRGGDEGEGTDEVTC